MSKPIHVKPSFYSYCFEPLKEIALKYGYNLVIHGSLNRDMDLIAIPWVEETGNVDEMINDFSGYLEARIINMTEAQKYCFPHGRYSYVLNMNRGSFNPDDSFTDKEYYVDISIIPTRPE